MKPVGRRTIMGGWLRLRGNRHCTRSRARSKLPQTSGTYGGGRPLVQASNPHPCPAQATQHDTNSATEQSRFRAANHQYCSHLSDRPGRKTSWPK